MKLLYFILSWIFGRNIKSTPPSLIIDQMNEKRPLPLGMQEFEDWSDRIISGTLLQAEPEGQKFALATMLMHLSPTTDHETDGYFIKSLRKSAVNQIAHAKMQEIKTKAQERFKKEEELKAEQASQSSNPLPVCEDKGVKERSSVLEDDKLQTS